MGVVHICSTLEVHAILSQGRTLDLTLHHHTVIPKIHLRILAKLHIMPKVCISNRSRVLHAPRHEIWLDHPILEPKMIFLVY